jgi:hypothetical protein
MPAVHVRAMTMTVMLVARMRLVLAVLAVLAVL